MASNLLRQKDVGIRRIPMPLLRSTDSVIVRPAWTPAASRAHEPPVPIGMRICGACVALLVCTTLAFAVLRPVQVLPLLGPAPPLVLRDADGVPVTVERLRGAIVVFQFSALRCAPRCDDGREVLREVQRRLDAAPALRRAVRFVTVVLDGQGRPQALRALGAALGADPRRWRVTTGEAMQLKDTVGGGFGVYYAEDAAGRVALDPVTILMDERGIVRAAYRTASPDAGLIWRDIGLVAREASSRGAARALYSAAHLFLCYPRQ